MSVDEQASSLRESEVKAIKSAVPGTTTVLNPYPANYFPRKSAEERLAVLSQAGQVADKLGLQKPTFDAALIELAEQKKKELELYNFESWFEHIFNQNDPAENRLMGEIYPEYKQKREQYITEKYELAKRFDLLQLRGPKTKEDLILMYLVLNNQITVPKLDLKTGAQSTADDISRGLLNVNRWTYDRDQLTVGRPGALFQNSDLNYNVPSTNFNPDRIGNTQFSSKYADMFKNAQ